MICHQNHWGGGMAIYVVNMLQNLSKTVKWIANYNVERDVEYAGVFRNTKEDTYTRYVSYS